MKTNEIINGVVINPSLLSKESLTTHDSVVDYYAEGSVDWNKTLWLNENYAACSIGIGQEKAYIPKFGGEFNMQTNKDSSVKVGKYWITRVIHNNPATIVFWSDGTKTVARTQNGDPYDPTAGLLVCVMKKMVGNDQTQKLLNDWVACDIEEYGPMFGEDYVYTDITMKDVRKKHREK
jgi:hypothetical protein